MNELLWLLLFIVTFGGLVIWYRLFGKGGLFAWIALAGILANIQVVKTIELFGITATLGNIIYASSFLATDILSERYGKRDANKAVGIGFCSIITMALVMNIALLFRPAPSDFSQDALKTIFSVMPRISLASLAAYGFSQFHDVWSYHYWKRRLPDRKHLWVRNNASTMVSQIIDTLVFVSVAFWGVYPFGVLVQIFITTYVIKWVVALLDTPFLYLVTGWKNRDERVEQGGQTERTPAGEQAPGPEQPTRPEPPLSTKQPAHPERPE